MAVYTTIDNPELYFQTVIWSGDSNSPRTITLDGSEDMQPSLIWSKKRSGADYGQIYDSVRGFGASKELVPSDNFDEGNATNSSVGLGYISSVTSDGFVLTEGNHGTSSIRSLLNNHSGSTHVAWCWKESADAGFDMVTYTGNQTARTISHSLSAVPHWMVIKNRGSTYSWQVYHHKNTSAPETEIMYLNQTAATSDSNVEWNDTAPTSSVFTVGTDVGVNQSSQSHIAYLWSEKQGFSKFGKFTGNGNADGIFVPLSFRPATIILKNASAAGEDWTIWDNKRDIDNPVQGFLYPNTTGAEVTGTDRLDFLSNGFKLRDNNAKWNGSGNTHIFMAFAEAPFVNSKGVPCNAR